MPALSPSSLRTAFRSFAGDGDYPCVMATSALRRGEVAFHAYPTLDASAADALARDLGRFAHEPEPERGVRSFVAVFGGDAPDSERAFEERLWAMLSALHARDGAGWDPAVSADPDHPEFSFSFAGRAFYVVGMHPRASRPARRLGHPALVFNPHEQFERLRREGRYDKVRSLIRDRDRAFAGSVNPMLDDFGVRSEARQYAGRAVGEGWQCPFAAATGATADPEMPPPTSDVPLHAGRIDSSSPNPSSPCPASMPSTPPFGSSTPPAPTTTRSGPASE